MKRLPAVSLRNTLSKRRRSNAISGKWTRGSAIPVRKVFPENSDLVTFSRDGCRNHLEAIAKKEPADLGGLTENKK